MDVADIETTAAVVAEKGPFDVLVNSGGTGRHSAAVDTTAADFDAVMAVNLRGAYFVTQAVARGLISAGRPAGGSRRSMAGPRPLERSILLRTAAAARPRPRLGETPSRRGSRRGPRTKSPLDPNPGSSPIENVWFTRS